MLSYSIWNTTLPCSLGHPGSLIVKVLYHITTTSSVWFQLRIFVACHTPLSWHESVAMFIWILVSILWYLDFLRNSFSSLKLWLCRSSSLPSLCIMSGRCGRHESPEMITEPMRQGKCFWACIHLWASPMMRFILCLTWHECVVPNWSGNISDFAPLHLEKNHAPKQFTSSHFGCYN